MTHALDLGDLGLNVPCVLRNAAPPQLYEAAVQHDHGALASSGALVSLSGTKTGRSPKDKRIVQSGDAADDIWWGEINIPLTEHTFLTNRQRAIDYLNTQTRLYVVDGFAGWQPRWRLKVRVICARPYHALFMHNMLIRPTAAELENFGRPDFTIINAGQFPANVHTPEMTSRTSVDLSFHHQELIILGTEYAGEMKKGVFTLMNYLLPKQGVLSMHCSANEGPPGDVSLFFGLSGTGKTTLSADPHRRLIGDDEHGWSDEGVFNIEGGCYAKCIHLSREREPEIYHAIRFGAVLENVVYDEHTRDVDFGQAAITENTRAAYPIEFIANAKTPCTGAHPRNIIFLACDAFGVLPPVSKLSTDQAMYHFLSGYTAKVAGTEMGVREPQATFSACFGAAFLVWPPGKYAELLAERIVRHDAHAWLVNTGWTGGPPGQGARIPLAVTRAIIDAIHAGQLAQAPTYSDPCFRLATPVHCPGVGDALLRPRETWPSPTAYDAALDKLAQLFRANFAKFADHVSPEVAAAGPHAV